MKLLQRHSILSNKNLFSTRQASILSSCRLIGVIIFFFTSLFILQSCSIKKYIPDDELLYRGATIDIKSDTLIKHKNDLKTELGVAFQRETNKKFLGWYYGLYFYYKAQKDNPGFVNRWLNKKIGEEPVYQSDIENIEIEKLMTNRLENSGYFYSTVTSDWSENNKKKTANINYSVKVPLPYKMASYQLDTLQPPIYKEMQGYLVDSPFEKDMRFDLSKLKLERERIDNGLKMKGYYNFNPNFLIFEADTNQYKNKRFDLFLKLKKDVPKKSMLPYKISKINVYTNYDIKKDSLDLDTVRFNNKNFISQELFFKPKYLDPFITLSEGAFYNPETSKNTARRLSTIGAYKFVNIQYNEVGTIAKNDSVAYLETNIFLSPLNKRALQASLKAVTKSNNFAGPTFALTYTNRNLFKGGELLNISANVGYEWQIASGGDNKGLSNLELGLKTELIYPRIIFPVKINSNFFRYAIPKTKMSIGFDYLKRKQLYTLLSGTAQFGYIWDANRYITHEIIPISTNYSQLYNTTEAFDEILEENPFLKQSFEQQFISGLNYSFTYNGIVDSKKTHQFYVNSTLDLAGNSLSLFAKANGEEPKTIFNFEYAQYAKADIDLRYHFNFGKEQKIAARLFAGYGYAYGNSEVIPFTKQYYSGGPYSVRAFRIRSLGPGTYNEETDANSSNLIFDNTGNIRLEANIEYRFPIYSFVKGAVFADAGNIWTSKENESYPNGKFTDNFINELGMGAGFGLRVDVQGFVIRFDLAAPFHDPANSGQYDFKIDEPILNFAIGYPF
ncbi:BamA/TamA family outer membrane protein [Aureibaculum sp. 2210JD6-5]|uniref:translocation and assembly module lipoprotein TamL n=1 Tax=Aureibaculum sp. 2210JD6-5 TaxID=3103957 RepID=UPI002AAE471E|nr:BamA/TamA family outer membrane protein [Aureibaculum sp. 2210JD6-5]MDY7394116.1 BamA/TamA family outer membrane protein [Aureibaculum sp. 2210JD6-5]